MKAYCVKCRKDTENTNRKMVRTKNNRLIMQSKCSVCKIKKSRFVKEQEAKKELKSLCKLEIQILFIKTNLIKLAFNMIWLMANQKI